jgi:hypothetical protein
MPFCSLFPNASEAKQIPRGFALVGSYWAAATPASFETSLPIRWSFHPLPLFKAQDRFNILAGGRLDGHLRDPQRGTFASEISISGRGKFRNFDDFCGLYPPIFVPQSAAVRSDREEFRRVGTICKRAHYCGR